MTKTREPQRTEAPGPWALGWRMLRSPSAAAEACRDPRAWRAVLIVYAAFEVGHLLFFWLKPADFPDANAVSFAGPAPGFLFWLRARLFDVPLQLALCAIVAALLRFFEKGTLGLKLAVGVAWAAVPAFTMAYYKSTGMPKPVLALITLAWTAPFPWLLKDEAREDLLSIVRFMLGLNALGVFLLAPLTVAAALRHQQLFMLSQGLVGFWLIGAAGLGLRALTGCRLPRAFLAVLLAVALHTLLVFSIYLLGLVPLEILKAVVYG